MFWREKVLLSSLFLELMKVSTSLQVYFQKIKVLPIREFKAACLFFVNLPLKHPHFLPVHLTTGEQKVVYILAPTISILSTNKFHMCKYPFKAWNLK